MIMEANNITGSIKNFIGKEIIDQAGNVCGSVKDFIIDTSSLSIRYALISEGGSFNPGIEEDYSAVPFNALHIGNPEAAQFTLDVSQKKLADGPKFSKADFKKKDLNFLQQIEDYYGHSEEITKRGAITDAEHEHQSYEGSDQISDNEPTDNHDISDEVDYDKIKGYKK